MENNKDIIVNTSQANVKLSQIIESVIKNHSFSQQAVKDTKNYILQGADPNLKFARDGETLLRLAFNYRQKDLFYFLLENNADINGSNKYGETLLHLLAILYDDNNNEDTIYLQELIKHKADIYAKTVNGSTPLHSAIYASNVDVIKHLINLRADINKKDQEMALEIVIDPIRDYDGKMIKELCNLKISLKNITVSNDNIFHRIIELTNNNHALTVNKHESIQQIKTIITHARFDNFEKGSKKTVLFALWFFEQLKLNNNIFIPNDVQLGILAKLPPSDLYPYNKLCRKLLENKYHHILLPQVHERVENIMQILASPNNENKTALELMLEKFANNQEHINKSTLLLSGELLQKNYDDFLEHFPAIVNSEKEEDKENLARQMFDNCTELFLK